MRYNGDMEPLLNLLRDFLSPRGIDSFAPIALSDCRITYAALLERSMANPMAAVILLIPYYTGDRADRNLSLYAVPQDYHLFTAELGKELTAFLSEHYPDHHFAFFSDHSPLDERDAAAKTGLGVIGDNQLLISPRYGSYVFLAELITDLPLTVNKPQLSDPQGCMHCHKCRLACPSPTNCLSAITQKKGELSEEECALMRKHDTVWGCDICQTVCPMNTGIQKSPIPFFEEKRIWHLTSEQLRCMDKSDLKSRAFAWRGRSVIERNLKIAERIP